MNFEKWAEHGRAFVKEIARELGNPADERRAGHALRIVLHVLRDRLDPQEGLQLVAQLPMFIKGVWVDGWRLSLSPDKSIRNADDFIDAMYDEGERIAQRDFRDRDEARRAAAAVLRVVKRHVSEGEADDVGGLLPRPLRQLWEAA